AVALDLLRLHPDAWFIVIGDGPQEAAFRSLLNEYGIDARVLVLEPVADVRPLLTAMDILLVPSLTEGCPNVVLEGMAMEKAVVASRIGGIAELIISDQDGVLFDNTDPSEAVAILALLLRDARKLELLGAR